MQILILFGINYSYPSHFTSVYPPGFCSALFYVPFLSTFTVVLILNVMYKPVLSYLIVEAVVYCI